jgi:hypothetical protein
MYKSQYKSRSPVTPWMTLGTYATEADAIASALSKKKRGALIVRVLAKNGDLVYVN